MSDCHAQTVLRARVQRHLKTCTDCQGRAGLGSTGFATYAVREREEPRRLLPEKESIESPLGQQTVERDKQGMLCLVFKLHACIREFLIVFFSAQPRVHPRTLERHASLIECPRCVWGILQGSYMGECS